MNLNLSTEVTWAFTCLRVSSLVSRGWLSYSTRCVWLHYRWAQTGRTVPRVGFIRIILSEHICFWHDWLHLIIDTSSFLLYFSCQKNNKSKLNKSKLCVHIKCFFVVCCSVFLITTRRAPVNKHKCSVFGDCRDYAAGYCCHCKPGYYEQWQRIVSPKVSLHRNQGYYPLTKSNVKKYIYK